MQPKNMKDFESNLDLISKSNNKTLKDAVEMAKKIVDGDTNYDRILSYADQIINSRI